MTRSTEHERIALLRGIFAANESSDVLLAIGDDAAVLAPGAEPLVLSVDAAVEGTHFRRDLMSLEDAGYRATMAALSDLAAMGARPAGVLSSLVLPASLSDEELTELARGQRDAAAACGTTIIGGNLARGEGLSISTTVIGRAARPLTRSGASAGDRVWVAGDLGWAAAGLGMLFGDPRAKHDRAVQAFRRPIARIEDGISAARQGATAAVDVSDGAGADAGHLARASGVRVVLEEAALADDVLDAIAASSGKRALELVLGGGEDYALLVTAPPSVTLEGFRLVGICEAGEPRVFLRDAAGGDHDVAAAGFDHFRG